MLRKPLPFETDVKPHLVKDIEFHEWFVVANDKRLALDTTFRGGGGMGFVITALGTKALYSEGATYMAIPSSIIALICLLYVILPTKRYIIFDREKQNVILPPLLWGRSKTVPFTEIIAFGGANIMYPAVTTGYGLSIATGIGLRPYRLGFKSYKTPENTIHDWAFYLWYMNRSRPLPPCEGFDPYREADKKRRLAEFPPEEEQGQDPES